jgi:phosphate transport system substrate-binding protein
MLLGLVSACGSGGNTRLVGAGSTLVAPLVAQWQRTYPHASIRFGPLGSGGAIRQMTARTVDFGASDAPLTHGQAAACRGCVQIPWALAATTVAYNVPGVTRTLRLSGPVLAEIYLGRIRQWNDARLRRLNPGLKLPSIPIHPFYRAESSGDTYAFTDFLSRVSPSWRSRVGSASISVSWPTGTGASGNPGMAAAVEGTPGALGYVAVTQAIRSHLHSASVENRSGAFVAPETKTIAAAARTARFRRDDSASIVDPPRSAKQAYPISTFTYAIVSRSSGKLPALKPFLQYAVTTGQKYATPLGLAPLPQNVVARAETVIKGL